MVTTAPDATLDPRVRVTWFKPGLVETEDTVAAVPPAVTGILPAAMELVTEVS
jgi:hypothetical protein